MKYKAGDRVKVRKDLKTGKIYGVVDFVKEMEKFRGKNVTIKKAFEGYGGGDRYQIQEDNGKWTWSNNMFEPIITNFDKVKEEIKLDDVGIEENALCSAINRVRKEMNCGTRSCIECRKWLAQPYEEKILDKAEKEYLSAVIKPFRDRVERVAKHTFRNKGQHILIDVREDDFVVLPFFEEDTMYKGMELWKGYTLEELGL